MRTCVACRKKDLQQHLVRLKIENAIKLYDGRGRSFYLCKECVFKDSSHKALKRMAKSNDIKEQLKEIQKICQQL